MTVWHPKPPPALCKKRVLHDADIFFAKILSRRSVPQAKPAQQKACAALAALRQIKPLANGGDCGTLRTMIHYAFRLNNADLIALPSGALHWPAQNLLCVSDLHLGKSHRLARRGGALLPPYETRATLTRLDADLELTQARNVVCLGDSFDDLQAADTMDEPDHLWLTRLMAGRDWAWVEGNHDPGPLALGGSHRAEIKRETLCFRHIAMPGAIGEISGHYHPKARLAGQSRPCFLLDAQRLILPAYGTYTGGLWCDAPELVTLMHPNALAILTGARALPLPMRGTYTKPRASTLSR